MTLGTVEQALALLQAGKPVLVADDEDRENEADVVMAAQHASAHWLGWAIRHGSGVICAPMPEEVADRLQLPPMVATNEDPKQTAYTVSVDARAGVTTGISAADRSRTLQVLADPKVRPDELTRPGHVFPLRARPGGVIQRAGHTEAAVDLCRIAGLAPVGAIVELVHDDGSMMRLPDAERLAESEGLVVITIADLARWRRRNDRVRRAAQTMLPTRNGTFAAWGYLDLMTGAEHVALISPHGTGDDPALVRMHSECLTGDTFGSLRCDCGPQLQASLARIGKEPGVVIYLRGHEGRGVGLIDKLRAYALQDTGLDTVDAQTRLGLPIDAREFDAAGSILGDLGIHSVRLLTNNPRKRDALEQVGIRVEELVPLEVGRTPQNAYYLHTKKERLGHLLTGA